MKLKIILLLRLKKESWWGKDLVSILSLLTILIILILIALSVTTGSLSIPSFATVIRGPVEIAGASFSFAFSISTGIVKKLLKTTRSKNKKTHNKIVILAGNKLNSIDSKISEALINNEISHEDFMMIIDEKKISITEGKH